MELLFWCQREVRHNLMCHPVLSQTELEMVCQCHPNTLIRDTRGAYGTRGEIPAHAQPPLREEEGPSLNMQLISH